MSYSAESSVSGRVRVPKIFSKWALLAMVVAAALFLSTLQTSVNGSPSPYATDVGEIQNALPRWGTIHWSAYPLYSLLGSSFVTLLRWLGVPPAAGTSLFSTVWGVLSVGLVVELLRELRTSDPLSVLSGLTAAASTSLWIDASLAEVHTLTVAFTVASLLFALRFARSGERRHLFLLVFAFSQGIAHQRAIVLLGPALAVFCFSRWRTVWRHVVPLLALSLLAPLTYLYLPWRVQQGATWIFGSPGSWTGVARMLLDNRTERIVVLPESIFGWAKRLRAAFDLATRDLPAGLLVAGLGGLLTPLSRRRWRAPLALTLVWVPSLLLSAAISIGRVGDAQLAVQLPVALLATVGLGLLADSIRRLVKWGHAVATALVAVAVIVLVVLNRPAVLKVTQDPSALEAIAQVEQHLPALVERPTTFVALWGNDYWALAYAQEFEDRLPGLDLVDHNADFDAILSRGSRLVTYSRTFYLRSLSWWKEQLGIVYLVSTAPGLIQIAREPPLAASDVPSGPGMDLGCGIAIRSALLNAGPEGSLSLTVYWEAERTVDRDYSVGVYLVSHDPPRNGDDVLSQADQRHPVHSWYPTSGWQVGEIISDHYVIAVPHGSQPQAVRISLYHVDEDGGFVNTDALSLPVSSGLLEQ